MLIRKYVVGIALTVGLISPVAAQEEKSDNIARMFLFEAITGHEKQANEGWKAFWQCITKNEDGEGWSWSAWRPVTGKHGGILYRSGGHNWADFDQDDTDNACDEVFETSIAPHIEDYYSTFTQVYPDLSQEGDKKVKLVNLIDFDVESMKDAMEMLKSFHETSVANGDDGYMWERFVTSVGDWDLRVAVLMEKYADMAPDGPGFWERQAAHHGEEAAAALRERWMANTKNVRARMWSRDDKLSYSPSKEK